MNGVAAAAKDLKPAKSGGCCAGKAAAEKPSARALPEEPLGADLGAYVVVDDGGLAQLHLMVDGIHCGGCIQKIEGALKRLPEVETARLNLTTRRLLLTWHGAAARAADFAKVVSDLGYRAVPYDPARHKSADAEEEAMLMRSMAVAGFAEGDLDIQVQENVLTITGKRVQSSEADGRNFLHRGIAERSFERRFHLADNVEVREADLQNGLLSLRLEREIPEEKKPRQISINGESGAKLIQGGKADAA